MSGGGIDPGMPDVWPAEAVNPAALHKVVLSIPPHDQLSAFLIIVAIFGLIGVWIAEIRE